MTIVETPGTRDSKNPKDSKDTKERILDAAEKLFAEHGVAATSMRNVPLKSATRSKSV